ncbi:MAG: hypothetical protein ACE5G1_03400 [bacterium]
MQNGIKTGVSYFGNRNPRHFEKDLEEILSHNCNFIVHTFSENDQQFYKETMRELVAMSREAGLECYVDPWGVGRIFGGETYSSFALNNIDACQVLPDGALAPALCFNHPKVRDFLDQWIADACEIGADVIFWDEPHFFINLKERNRYDVWYCNCDSCSNKFRESYGHDLKTADRETIITFRETCVMEFLENLCQTSHEAGMKNALCLLPFKDSSIGLSDWSKVAAIEALDIFGTDPYWIFFEKEVREYVGRFSMEVSSLCKTYKKEAQIWIQAYKIPAGRETELKEAVEVAYSEGIRNFAAWSYYGNAYMSYNRSEDPQKVWDILGDVYGQLLNSAG